MAINDEGTLEAFDWRISIASVVNDGVFSDFSGYQRNLVLISGQGIMLNHVSSDGHHSCDKLLHLLDVATFDGSFKTSGILNGSSIKDFNIITNKKKIMPEVNCYVDTQQITVNLVKSTIYFAYSLTSIINVERNGQENTLVPQGSLLKISFIEDVYYNEEPKLIISGENMILVKIMPTETDTL